MLKMERLCHGRHRHLSLAVLFILPAAALHCTLLSVRVAAWGGDGHRMVCALAMPLMTREATSAVLRLLPPWANASFPSVCSWADDIRHRSGWGWSTPLHYVDTPDFACSFNFSRDCHSPGRWPKKGQCVVAAIANYSQLLTNFSSSRGGSRRPWLGKLFTSSQAEAAADSADMLDVFGVEDAPATAEKEQEEEEASRSLMFLAHFVGDIHQPLHVGFAGDGGGNKVLVHWYNTRTNLHTVWDSLIISRAVSQVYGKNILDMAAAIGTKTAMSFWGEEENSWGACPSATAGLPCPERYAEESVRAACRWAYRNATPGSNLTDPYFFSRLPVVEMLLAKAAVRLAAILNQIFSSSSSSSHAHLV